MDDWVDSEGLARNIDSIGVDRSCHLVQMVCNLGMKVTDGRAYMGHYHPQHGVGIVGP